MKVDVRPGPVCLISGNKIICPGGSTQLCVPAVTGNTYLWSTGATTNCITVSAAGTYTVTVTSSTGCSSTCSKKVVIKQGPVCNITGNGVICQGSTTTLSAPTGAGITYLWNTGATTKSIAVNTAGTFSVTVTKNGCSSTCYKTVTMNTKPSCSIKGNLSPAFGNTTTLCAPQACTAYLWNTGATTQCLQVTSSGTYTVTTTNSSGCTSSCTVSVNYNFPREGLNEDNTSFENDNTIEVKAYPNPFSTMATIEFQIKESNSHIVVELYSLTGNKIATLFDENIKQDVSYKVEVNAENLLHGVYFYRIVNGDRIINRKLILIK